MKGKKGEDCDIDLGLAISALSLKYGQTRSQIELAAYCGCSQQAIQYIERRALRKMRIAFYRKPELQELAKDVGLRSVAAT